MNSYTENSKKSIYKWREANKDRYNAYMVQASKQYYLRNKATCNEKRTLRKQYQREWQRMNNILLD